MVDSMIDYMVDQWTDLLHDQAYSTKEEFIPCTWCDNYLNDEKTSWIVPDYLKKLDCGFCSQECFDDWKEYCHWQVEEQCS